MRSYIIDKHGLQVQFYWEAAPNQGASDKAGRPIFDKVLYARCMAPSQPRSVIVHELERLMRDPETGAETTRVNPISARFQEALRAFKSEGNGGDLSGTPIESLPGVDVRLAATLKSINLFTVEGLAKAGDNVLPLLGLNYDLRKRAQDFLAGAKDVSQFTKLASENESMKDQIAALKQQVERLASIAPAVGDDDDLDEDSLVRRRGRPRKGEAA